MRWIRKQRGGQQSRGAWQAMAFLFVGVCAIPAAHAAPITFDFRLYGVVKTPSLGSGDMSFKVTYNGTTLADGAIGVTTGNAWTSSGLLSGQQMPGPEQWGTVDLAFSRTVQVDPVQGGTLQMELYCSAVRMPVDFANRWFFFDAPEPSGRQGLTITGIRGGEIEFIAGNTLLEASATEEAARTSASSTDLELADARFSYAWVRDVTDGIYNLSAFVPVAGFPDDLIADEAYARITAVDLSRPNIRLVPEPALWAPLVAVLLGLGRPYRRCRCKPTSLIREEGKKGT